VKCFKNVGSRDITELPCSSPPSTATIQCNEQKADALFTEDQKVTGKQSAAWRWTQCHAGDDKGFGILENLLLLSSLTAVRQEQNSIH
jgi:hypothetical protein